ncbi:MAG: trimethylamine methyltransferase family protein [Promethearchaeota archaeon]
MKLKKLEVLSKEEVETITNSALRILETIGIKIDDDITRKKCEEKGAMLDKSSSFVKFPKNITKDLLKLVPESFKLHGPDGTFNFEVNTKTTQFATIGTPVRIYDPLRKDKLKKSVLADTIQQIRVVDSLKNVNCSHIDVWPSDVKFTAVHAHCLYQWAKNTKKPYGLGCLGKLASQDMMNITSLITGSKEELIKRPRLVGFMNPTSPLQLPKLMTNGLEVFAKYKQPVIVAPEALAGATAPVTLAGLLAQTCAEIIGGIILAQVFSPKSPVFFGTVSCATDMRSGNSALGAIESSLITIAIAQIARSLNIPSRGPGGVTESKCFDVQNGFERFSTMSLAAQAGINYITCAGTYESSLAEALELLVIDDELAGLVKRAMEGINVNEDTIAIDVIKKVATSEQKGTNFLGESHTRKYMHKELYIPKLIDRGRRSTWKKKGSKDIIERARVKVDKVLADFQPYELSKDVDTQLLALIKEIEARPLELYMDAEGISGGSVNITGTEISLEKN